MPLLGNREEMMLASLEGQSELRHWREFGGREALASYSYTGGVDLRPADLRTLIPRGHLELVRGCRDYLETVRNFFVHAYYEPNRPLPDSDGADSGGPLCHLFRRATARARWPSWGTRHRSAARFWTWAT